MHGPQSVFPAISLARVEVFADAGTLAPEDIRERVAAPLEAAFAGLAGVRATRVYADQGKLEIELDFDPQGDVQQDLRAVEAAVNGVRERLPVERVRTLIEGPNMEPVVTYALRSRSTSQAALRALVEAAELPVFLGTPGLGRVTVFGGPRIALEVALDAPRLRAHGLAAGDVVAAIAEAERAQPAGTIVRGNERLLVEPPQGPRDAASLGALRLREPRGGTIALSALGAVRAGDLPAGEQASFDGEHAIILNAYPTVDGDAVTLAREFAARLPKLLHALPPDTQASLAWDQTRLIVASQNGVRDEMLAGALIALGIIYLFLRDRAMTLVAAVVVPVAIALTALVLVRGGLTLNLMTLGGLAIAVGLVIDEAIVVIEASARELSEGGPADARAAIARAVRRVARPLVTATAANVAVFVPLGILSGVPGFFFRALSITLATALLVSILLSLFAAPLLAELFGAHAERARPARFSVEDLYARMLDWALGHARIVYAAALAILALTVLLLAGLPTDFLPDVDEGEFEIKYALPPGMSLDASDALATQLERAVIADPAVAHEARLSGVDTNGYLSTPPDAGTIRVTLKPNAPPFDTVADRLRLAIANVDQNAAIEIHQLLEDQINDLTGAPEPIQITIRGPQQRVLTDLASGIADSIEDVRGVVDTFDGVIYEARTIDATPKAGDPRSPGEFATGVRARAGGIVAAEIPARGVGVPIVVRLSGGTPLEREATLSAPQLVTQVLEENGERIERVTAGIERANLSTVIGAIRRQLSYELAHAPPGYSIEIGGAAASQRAAFDEFALVLGIAIALVFAVLVLAFDSFRLPLVILAAIPLSPIGVACALYLTKTPVNISSFMGMLLLAGIVVRNGILLVDGANRRRLAGLAPREALERAARERLRPILMTTCAALGALVPLAIGIGAGSEMARPLAIAVAGGLTTSTAFTLMLIPVLYAATYRGKK